MRILYLGDLNSILVRRLIDELGSAEPGIDACLLDFFKGRFYRAAELKQTPITPIASSLLIKRLNIFIGAIKSVFILFFLRRFDVINIHYLNPFYKPFLALITRKSGCLILSMYGSDFYLLKDSAHNSNLPFFKAAHFITFSTRQMSNDFVKQNPQFADKVKICRFGLGMLDQIDALQASKEKARSVFGFPDDRIVICCGHSANRRELHSIIIAQLNLLDRSEKDKIFAVFPFTYNLIPELYQEVKEAMQRSGIQYRILTNHLSDDEIATLRVATDIMVSVPSSDQMTASMLETLYAGGIVVTGKWLPYDLLDAHNIAYFRIRNHHELAPQLKNLIISIRNGLTPINTLSNRQTIGDLFNWQSTIHDWLAVYHSGSSGN
jgi:hypothetical protein